MHGLLDNTYENMLCYTTAHEVLGKLYTKSGDVFTARYYQKVMQHTYDRYMIVATRYVQYLLQVRRRGDEVPGRISDELAKALDDVEVAQGQNNHVMMSEALTNVWCAVLDESTDMNSLDLEYCPTVYILCTALQANDTFKQPNNWTPTLAALLWICRLFLLVRRQLDPSSPGALTEDAAVKTEGHIGYYLGSRLTYVRKCTSEEGKPGVDVVFETRPAPGQEFRTLTANGIRMNHDDLRAAKRVAQEGTYELLFNIAPMQLEKQLRPGQVYRTIQAVTKRFLGTSITVSAWRHMSVAWLRTLVLHHTPEPSLGALNVAHSQSQHAGRTARNVYGRTQLDHKFVSSEAQYGHQFVSEEWHKLMKLVDVENQIQAEAVDGQTCVQQVVHKQVVIQSSRVRNASTQVQATVGTQTDLEVEACLDAEDDIDDIIAGLDLDEAEAAESSMPVAVPRAVKEAASTALQQEPSQHNDQTQQEEYEDQLWLAQCVRQAWKTTFRDWDQYRLAQAVTRHEAQDGWLLAVAPTGMGKTLCTLAHLQPRKVVVWVVPLRELARDLCRRFEQADIVSQWAKNDGRDMQVNVQVIVMTVDFLVGYGMRWVQTLVQQKRLAMLVMDEVHTMLVDTSYRDSLVRCPGRLDHLRQDPSVKCVGLTGTLCPKDERALLQQLDCTEDASYQTFRMPTMRTDLRLAVQQGTTKAFEMFVERHYDLLEQEGRVDRMLIFCDTKKQVEALSTQLARTLGHEQSLAVDADMSAEDTRAALEQWRSGTQSLVLVATSCLGAGLDMPNVRKVIWFGSGYNGYTLSQAFGRAGRDRRGGEATLWIPRGTAVSEDLQPFASMKRCLTFELGWLLDGEGHICAAAGAPACTVCSMMQPTITARHPSREAHGAPVSHEGQTRAKRAQLMVPSAPIQSDDFNTALLWMSTYCWACSCSRDRLVAHHQPSSCPVMKGRCFRCHCRGHGSSNCQVTLGAGVCYRCWRPQKIGGDRVVECTGRA
ncbi:uncharacterized protein MONBRDRAFT_11282 [Monosiga brevicollis MX1]|uniref:DNA 3'-5' helicase n=1 Tax=Monosiga brevicollis TaxID=81824 RepID=A9V8R7_MONBE|nr:uncharacterized protein MONBRDRAFT_11282 [Monosiga brevicollis MX1]EDQ86132.1 predicted protein [Monosiga brevicollis MX1]|eukprot:XP_001749057.1 hypothetical protein [Monosiga brevicollis MX1]